MSFDGIVFNKVIKLLNEKIINARINKIFQISDNDYIFVLFFNKTTTNLIINVSNTSSYISLNPNISKNESIESNHFTKSMFYHLTNGRISKIEQLNNDRIAKITISKINELGIEKTSFLYVELTGKLTNLILTKDNDLIIDCLHKIGITALRTIQNGCQYNLPYTSKINSIYEVPYKPSLSIKDQYGMMSLNLSNEIEHLISNGISIENIKNNLLQSSKLYIFEKDFNIIPLTHLNQEIKEYEIFDGLNIFYNSKKENIHVNDDAKKLIKDVNKILKRYTSKKKKLEEEIHKSSNFETYKKYADLIYSSGLDLNNTLNEIKVIDYDTNDEITILLDLKYSLKDNANNFYKKYHKYKNSINFINEQIDICNSMIEYLSSLIFQLENSNEDDIMQIKQELIDQKLLNIQIPKQRQNKNIKTLEYSVDGIIIHAGKNNIQNEYLTFKLAKYNEYFFHVADYSGSHVVVHSDTLNEKIIRFAANLAAYNSQARLSSSVPVQYTLVKNVKKIPGGKPGKVLLKEYKTIYIDPTNPNA